jgi:hypothetical protein
MTASLPVPRPYLKLIIPIIEVEACKSIAVLSVFLSWHPLILNNVCYMMKVVRI